MSWLKVLGGMVTQSTFRIVQHDPLLLKEERARLLGIVRQATPLGTLSEVGSTAVEGVIGKEDLDFAISVPRSDFARARAHLDGRFTRDPSQISNDEYQGYKLPSEFDATVQLFVAGSRYDTFERFLAALRTKQQLRRSYNEFKRQWDGRPMDEYRAAKRNFIETALRNLRQAV